MSVTSEIASRNACTRARPCGTRVGVVALAHAADRDHARELALVDLVVEVARRTDELLQVLEPALGLDGPFGLELGEVAALGEHRLERAADTVHRRDLDLVHELEQILAAAECLPRDAGDGRVADGFADRHACAARVRVDLRDRRVADTAPRRVDDALPRHFVVRVHERAHVRERVLDLAPVVELHTAEHAVRDARANEPLFDDAALHVRAVEDRDVAVAVLLVVDETMDLAHDERRFVVLVVTLEAHDRFARALVGPQVLRPARRVVLDDRVGRVEDALRRPVVLVEHDRRGFRERVLELDQVPEVRPAELIYRLIDIADDHDAAVVLGEEVDELELRGVGVLELVDEDVTEAVAVALERFGVFTEQPHREHEQVVEVDGGRFLQAPLVLGVHVGEAALGRARRPSWRTPPGARARSSAR